MEVCKLLAQYGLHTSGVLTRIADELGVSRATVCRDRQSILDGVDEQTCPHCGKPVPPDGLDLVDSFGEPVRQEPPAPEEPWGEDDGIEGWFREHLRKTAGERPGGGT
jgi:hypothetical protein